MSFLSLPMTKRETTRWEIAEPVTRYTRSFPTCHLLILSASFSFLDEYRWQGSELMPKYAVISRKGRSRITSGAQAKDSASEFENRQDKKQMLR